METVTKGSSLEAATALKKKLLATHKPEASNLKLLKIPALSNGTQSLSTIVGNAYLVALNQSISNI